MLKNVPCIHDATKTVRHSDASLFKVRSRESRALSAINTAARAGYATHRAGLCVFQSTLHSLTLDFSQTIDTKTLLIPLNMFIKTAKTFLFVLE